MNDSQRKVFDLLQAAGERGATTGDLVRLGAGNRFGARIRELREDFGCTISARVERAGSWRYTLLDSPDLDGLSDPLRPVESGAGGALGDRSGAPAPALFDAAASVSPPEPVPHWRQDAA